MIKALKYIFTAGFLLILFPSICYCQGGLSDIHRWLGKNIRKAENAVQTSYQDSIKYMDDPFFPYKIDYLMLALGHKNKIGFSVDGKKKIIAVHMIISDTTNLLKEMVNKCGSPYSHSSFNLPQTSSATYFWKKKGFGIIISLDKDKGIETLFFPGTKKYWSLN